MKMWRALILLSVLCCNLWAKGPEPAPVPNVDGRVAPLLEVDFFLQTREPPTVQQPIAPPVQAAPGPKAPSLPLNSRFGYEFLRMSWLHLLAGEWSESRRWFQAALAATPR